MRRITAESAGKNIAIAIANGMSSEGPGGSAQAIVYRHRQGAERAVQSFLVKAFNRAVNAVFPDVYVPDYISRYFEGIVIAAASWGIQAFAVDVVATGLLASSLGPAGYIAVLVITSLVAAAFTYYAVVEPLYQRYSTYSQNRDAFKETREALLLNVDRLSPENGIKLSEACKPNSTIQKMYFEGVGRAAMNIIKQLGEGVVSDSFKCQSITIALDRIKEELRNLEKQVEQGTCTLDNGVYTLDNESTVSLNNLTPVLNWLNSKFNDTSSEVNKDDIVNCVKELQKINPKLALSIYALYDNYDKFQNGNMEISPYLKIMMAKDIGLTVNKPSIAHAMALQNVLSSTEREENAYIRITRKPEAFGLQKTGLDRKSIFVALDLVTKRNRHFEGGGLTRGDSKILSGGDEQEEIENALNATFNLNLGQAHLLLELLQKHQGSPKSVERPVPAAGIPHDPGSEGQMKGFVLVGGPETKPTHEPDPDSGVSGVSDGSSDERDERDGPTPPLIR